MKKTIAVIQLDISRDKDDNLNRAEVLIIEASKQASIVVLPEIFNCPYNAKTFHKYAETEFSQTTSWLERLSRSLGITIIGGSIPELEGDKMYNTSYTYSQGNLVAKYRKMHMFDVDIKDGITFKESDVLTPGDSVVTFSVEGLTIGIGICYDLRFPELTRAMVDKGAQVIVMPAAFNTVTGPAHWHLTARTRAVDNQVYFVMASPARSTYLSYKAYGHSLVIDPWGKILSEANEGEEIIYSQIDTDYIKKVRAELPLLQHRKNNLYS